MLRYNDFMICETKLVTFLKQKNVGFGIDELSDPDWLADLAFLTWFHFSYGQAKFTTTRIVAIY